MLKAMASVTTKAIRGARQAVPGWNQVKEEAFECSIITGGLTNKLNLVQLGAEHAAETPKALIRIFGEGTDEFIDRECEKVVCSAMSGTGIAPKVYGLFPGGRAEEFIDNAQSIKNVDLHRPNILLEVARLMAKMHSVDLNNQELAPIVKEKTMTSTMLRKLWDGACRTRFELDVSKALKLSALQVSSLIHEIHWLEKELEESGMGKVLCHRDLQSGNVMVQQGSDSSIDCPEKVFLIDFEYSGLDFCAFDYGNTFCEMAINNFCSSFPGFVLDPDMYPSNQQKREFFTEYLKHIDNPKRLFRKEEHQKLDMDGMVDTLCHFSELGVLASHMQWTLWGIVQAQYSSIDFGHLEYATARFDQYHSLRRTFEYQRASSIK